MQVYLLTQAISSVERNIDEPDQFDWPCDASGKYTASSTYMRLCIGYTRAPAAGCISRSWAPLKCKIFMWLACQYRLWTSDRRARHGLQDAPSPCYTCLQDEDNADHILVQRVYACEVWHSCFSSWRFTIHTPDANATFLQWWLEQRSRFRGKAKRSVDSVVILIAWAL